MQRACEICVRQSNCKHDGCVKLVIMQAAIICMLVVMVAIFLGQSSSRIDKMICTDNLTGAYTKRYFFKRLGHNIRQSRYKQLPVTVLLAEIDHFKRVNERYGHPFGDRVIREVTHAISISIRETDMLGRYGGEEFAAMLLDTNLKEAVKYLKESEKM